MKKLFGMLAGALMCMTGCSGGPKVDDHAAMEPKLDIRQFFNGEIKASGLFVDRAGKSENYFHVTMNGRFTEKSGTIDEVFEYNDGRKETRTWTIVFNDDGTYTGTAHDVIGKAEGRQSGNAAHMTYTLRIKTKSGKTYDIAMSDWMFKVDDETVINRIDMKKFGLHAGELIVVFRKPKV
ncbi:MAG: DUF3833 domain-containing protein [bacterium]|nr:DUF3833 domain-containing protein [bacterium]